MSLGQSATERARWDSSDADAKLRANVHPPDWANPDGTGRYDLVVIGAGTAGLVTAAGAAGLGARVALIEDRVLGGDCLNYGCVPSKALIRSARAVAEVRNASRYGVNVGGPVEGDFGQVMGRMRTLRAKLSRRDSAERFRGLGVDVFLGRGRFTSASRVEVAGRSLEFSRACIATGASPALPPIPGLAEVGYLTNETVFSLTDRPRRLVVIGGGPIGCELAQVFARLGSEVTIVDEAPRLLGREDEDAGAIVAGALQRDGVEIVLGAAVERVEPRGNQATVLVRASDATRALAADAVLVATGRPPGVRDVGLEAAGVEFDPARGVVVDDFLRTTNPRIWAAGDCCSRFKFTHAADAMARIVIRNALFFGRERASRLVMPWCTFTDPEVAHVGMYLRETRDAGLEATEIRIELRDVDRAVLDGEDEGFLKVIVGKRGKILGATLVSRHAGETISEISAVMTAGGSMATLGSTIHPYPTQAEIVRRAADAWNRARLTPWTKRILGALIAIRR
jgi:pyruvate/2-oxoglutarate dehydrogenase complex dihydrolipoamide dehydrogenase (E3) component